MRYHLLLNSIGEMVKTTKAFSRKLAVPRYMSTSVYVLVDHEQQKYWRSNLEVKKKLPTQPNLTLMCPGLAYLADVSPTFNFDL